MINIKKKLEDCIKTNKELMESMMFVNGEYVNTYNKKFIQKTSPIDGKKLFNIASCQEIDIDFAVSSAKNSYESREWVDSSLHDKKKVMRKLADLMEENIEELALLDTMETGRSIKNYYYDSIPKAIEAIRWFVECVDKCYGQATSMEVNSFSVIVKEPLGVVGIITPWNDPLVVSAWKFAPALLMGNSVVLKPSENSTYSILRVADLAKKAGLPNGVLNIVPGYGDTAGKNLALHDDVRGVFFTGSSQVGKLIMQYAGQSNLKKVGLECGGKSPFIVSYKCNDLKHAAAVLAKNIFYNQGQICSAPSRAIVDKRIKSDFIDLVAKESVKYIPKDSFDINSEVGCLVNKQQKKTIDGYINSALNSSATVINIENNQDLPSDNCVFPVILDCLNTEDDFVKEEIFGPVLIVLDFETIDKAIKIANESVYGLAASIWTDDLDEAYQVSRLLEAGIVHINSYGNDDNRVPFGGIKESGIGKDKSIYAFDEYSVTKTIWLYSNKILE
jgi:acyl-CoA reductase-like NAD-dependent aldehyde dehydrogenase